MPKLNFAMAPAQARTSDDAADMWKALTLIALMATVVFGLAWAWLEWLQFGV